MIVIKCPTCGNKIVWDDFQPMDIMCPNCRHNVNLRTSFKENIRIREMGPIGDVCCCPRCDTIVSRRWFVRCEKCGYWLFGPVSFHGNWPFILGLGIMYIMFSIYYLLYIQ